MKISQRALSRNRAQCSRIAIIARGLLSGPCETHIAITPPIAAAAAAAAAKIHRFSALQYCPCRNGINISFRARGADRYRYYERSSRPQSSARASERARWRCLYVSRARSRYGRAGPKGPVTTANLTAHNSLPTYNKYR